MYLNRITTPFIKHCWDDTRRIVQHSGFLSLGLEGQKQKYEDVAYRKEACGSLILKWFRSQVEQVKQLEGK